jgi:hypothetical protein
MFVIHNRMHTMKIACGDVTWASDAVIHMMAQIA